MKQMKLSQQLGWGFGSLVAMLVVVSSVAVWVINGAGSGFDSFKKSSEMTVGGWEVEDDLSKILVNMMQHLNTGEHQYIEAALELKDELDGDLKLLIAKEDDAAQKRGYEKTREILEDYSRTIVDIENKLTERTAVLNGMINQGETMLALSQEVIGDFTRDQNIQLLSLAADLQRDLLFGRLRVVKYLRDPTAEKFASGIEAMSDAKLGVLVTELSSRVKDAEIKDDFAMFEAERAAYIAGLHKYEAITQERNVLINHVTQDLGPELTALIQEFKNTYHEQQETIGADVAGINQLGLILVSALSVLAVVVGIVMTVVIGRLVRRPIGGEPADIGALADRIAAGDLTVEFTRTGTETGIYAAMRSMNDQLTKVVGEVVIASGSVSSASSQIAAGSQDLSQRTEEQASSLEETAASIEEMASTVKGSADNAMEATKLAEGARDNAMKGGDVVKEAIKAMEDISSSSNQIKDIIEVIEGITFQTNLLSLNASVEAARAGEQGRGFAVVAGEVGKLASKSADAAKDIKMLINSAVSKVESGSLLVNRSGEALGEIIASVTRVTDIVNEMAAAAQEQAAGISQVNKAVTQMDEVTQHNSSLVEETAAAAETLKEQSAHLQAMMSFFTLNTGTEGAVAAEKPQRAAHTPQPAPVRRPAAKKAALADDDWSEF